MYRIITISREFASGGRTTGKKVADALGYAYYDNELVTKIAKESGFAEAFVKENGEYAGFTSSLLFNLSLNNIGAAGTLSTSDQLYTYQHKIIRELAEKGNCVIVGRCADYILRDRTDCFNVFIHANMAFRIDRVLNIYQEKLDKPEKFLREKDKKRKVYYKYYTDRQWGVAQNYHLCLDTSAIGIDTCSQIILDLVKNPEHSACLSTTMDSTI